MPPWLCPTSATGSSAVERPDAARAAVSATATPAAATVASPVMARTFVVTSKGLGPGLADHCCVPGTTTTHAAPPSPRVVSSTRTRPPSRPSPAATRPAAPVTRPPPELPGRSATPTVGLTGATTGTAPSPSVSHPPRAARSAAARTPSTTAATDRSTPAYTRAAALTCTASASRARASPHAPSGPTRRMTAACTRRSPHRRGAPAATTVPELPRAQKSSTPGVTPGIAAASRAASSLTSSASSWVRAPTARRASDRTATRVNRAPAGLP